MAARRRFAANVAAQIAFERDARRGGTEFEAEIVATPAAVRYTFPVEVPVYDERRSAVALVGDGEPAVYLDGPECARHRYPGGELCMWYPYDPPEERWTPTDGLGGLINHVREHAYCEAECRAGHPWPKRESPGKHPRPARCETCSGQPSGQ